MCIVRIMRHVALTGRQPGHGARIAAGSPGCWGGGEAADCVIAASAALGRATVALAGVRCERSLLWVWVLFSFYFSLALTMLLIYLIRFLRLGFL